jgi:hypothetical protein
VPALRRRDLLNGEQVITGEGERKLDEIIADDPGIRIRSAIDVRVGSLNESNLFREYKPRKK